MTSALADAVATALRSVRAELETDAEREAGRRAAAEGGLRAYLRAAWPWVEPGSPYTHGWHIDAICDHLEAVTRGEIRNLVITMPPRHMKSLAVSVFWPTWVWTFAPETRWLFASYALQLSTRDSLKCRRLIESRWYRNEWGDAYRLTSDQNVKTRFENDRTGYRLATSVGGSATGEGGDIIVCDDPHKIEEASSESAREAVIEWWDQTMATRGNDPRTVSKVLIQQRVHERDLAGHVIEKGGYTHLCLPARFEPAHPFVWPDDPREAEGELLWPERFGQVELASLERDLGSYATAGQLQQRPAPAEGGLVKRAWWRYYEPDRLPPIHRVISSWDTAFKDKTTSDYVVGQVWGIAGANRYLLRSVRGQWGLVETIQQIRDVYRWVTVTQPRLGHHVLVENTANGPEIIAALRSEIPGVIPVRPRGDKTQRVLAVTPQIEAGNVLLPGFPSSDGRGPDTARTPGWVQSLIDEFASFPNASHDDQVDAATQTLLRAGRPKQDSLVPGSGADWEDDSTSARRGGREPLRDAYVPPLGYDSTL